MFGLALAAEVQPWVALAILFGMLVLFVREVFPPEVTAIGGAALMLVLGILPIPEATRALSNAAPWTIAFMFIIVGSLVRTGALDWITQIALRRVEKSPRAGLASIGLGVTGLSAFMNNTPLVVVMIPVFMKLSRALKLAPSKLMIPLSYMTILGGTLTLIGTSTNIVADGVAAENGLGHFGIFDITPVGLCCAAVGLTYLALFTDRLLPERASMAAMMSDKSRMKFFTEVVVPEGSALIGQNVNQVALFKRDSVRVIDVLRGDASLRRDMTNVVLQAGDRVVLRSPMSEILGMQAGKAVEHDVEKLSSVATTTVEVLIQPGCKMVGRTLGELRLRRRYGVYPLAVHRRDTNLGGKIDEVEVAVGDTLLLEGSAEDIQRLATDLEVTDISQPSVRAYRRSHAPIAAAVLAAVVILSSLDVAPILVLSFLGAAVVLLTGCIDADEAFASVDGRLMGLIFGMLAVGGGLEHSGAVERVVGMFAPSLAGLSPFFLILIVYALTSFLTEVVSNNAVAVIMTPIAIGLARQIGVDPVPLVVAVMFAASAAFSTPIGYQTNTLVYGPGGYRFSDYFRIGIPLNITMTLCMSLIIPYFFPF